MRPFFLLALSLPSLFAQKLVIDAGIVIDGRGGVLRNQQITIDGSRIVTIGGPHQPADIDLSKYTVMPGWIDTHVHLDWHFGKDGKIVRKQVEKPQETVLYDAENAWATLQGGFTTVQSVGSASDGFVRDRINFGRLPGRASSLHSAKSLRIRAIPKRSGPWSARQNPKALISSNSLPLPAWARAELRR